MRTFRGADNQSARAGVRGWSAHLRRFDRDDSGAIVLLGLVGIIILMMLAWVLYDAGEMSRQKLDTQAAADTAAYSQAAVKARSMNNLVYANIAKRSVVGIHSMYGALWAAYRDWYIRHADQCERGDDRSCEIVEDNRDIFEAEAENDFETFRDHNGEKYYLQDIVAIDNYQSYTHALTPWWAWGEAVLRAARNGANMAASFPAPRGKANGRSPIIMGITDDVIAKVGWAPLVRYTGQRDILPVKISTYKDMLEYGMSPEMSFREHEYPANLELHKQNSQGAATSQELLDEAEDYFSDAVLDDAQAVFDERGRPWRLFETTNRARWTTWTSNLVMTYRRDEEMFEQTRQKFEVPSQEYELDDEEKYRSSGYWGMARSEISFQGGLREPDLWHPRWTARLRPVALPGEFREAGIEMSAVYHDILPYLALSGIMITGDDRLVRDSMDDLVFMERASRALGQSTVEGITK